nr:TrbG/VirB9 family P-type conjugative transfer protein [Paraburkholderia strydomiana]
MRCEAHDDKMNHVFIKPHKPDIVNTLHLTTNRREYNFTLIASPAGGLSYQTVRVHYPRAPMARVRPTSATGLLGRRQRRIQARGHV